MHPSDRSGPERSARAWFWTATVSLCLLSASVAVTELVPATEGEPLALRWTRLLAGHPWRSALALALLAWALGPSHPQRAAPPPE